MARDFDDDFSLSPPLAVTIGKWIGRAALALVLAVVLARTTVLEYLRDPFGVTPGSPPSPSAPGAVTSLVMDLLAATPMLLVLLRAVIDRTFILRRSCANVVMVLLAMWIALSVSRADDRFAAAVDAANLIAALSMLWATQQLVRDWRSLRIIAGVIFGLLLIYAAHGWIDHFIELPARQENFAKNAGEMLKNMNIDPGSFEAERLLKKISGGELLGFSATINTFAAVLVTAGIVAIGAIIQRLKDREEPVVAGFMLAMMAAAVPVLIWTSSHTAFATPFIAVLLLLTVWLIGRWLNAHRRLALAAVLITIAAGTTLIVVVGMTKGKLYQDSLNFRWWYWKGAWSVWRERPWFGVGLDSFAQHYLAYRLPIASEEPKDPHNYVVKAFCELGIIGGVITLLWTGRALWEMTWPTQLPPPVESMEFREEKLSDLGRLSIIVAVGMLIAIFMSVDFTLINWEAAIEILKRLLYLCLGVIGVAMICLRSMQHQRIEDRPAPWLRIAMVIAVMIFLIHNLIDFSMFESSAMFFGAALAGACWGVGLPERPAEAKPVVIARFGIASLLWLGAALFLVVPTMVAESAAGDGDNSLRQASEDHPAMFFEAAKSYQVAADHWPGNADYPYRAAMALATSRRADPRQVRSLLDAAVAANPMSPKYYRVRAEAQLATDPSAIDSIRSDYEHALRIDPNAVDMRLEYADALTRLNLRADAKQQFDLALAYNDGLDPADPKRLDEKKLAGVKQTIARLGL